MKLETATLEMFVRALGRLEEGFADLPDIAPGVEPERIEAVLLETAERMQHNYPYFHPLYAGQMLKPPHPVARLAYMLSLWINPNNHALDGGRASSQMEKEATAQMAAMFGWQTFLGHLTSGGTMANLEAATESVIGSFVADIPIAIASIDHCFSCTDRMTVGLREPRRGTRVMGWEEIRRHGIEWYRRHKGIRF